jgi:hypothetical protein
LRVVYGLSAVARSTKSVTIRKDSCGRASTTRQY